MNKKFLLLCTLLIVTLATSSQNYKALIKHIVTEEQAKAQTEFELYVSEIKKSYNILHP
jgi:hypothetical protein